MLQISTRFDIQPNIFEPSVSHYQVNRHSSNKSTFFHSTLVKCSKYSVETLKKLTRLQPPTLLIWGAKDLWIPKAHGTLMHAQIPNSKLVILENSGHVPMEENPIESLAALKQFLAD